MAQWYGLTQEEVLKRLGTNRTGLSEEEAERTAGSIWGKCFKRAGRNALVAGIFGTV